MTDNDSGESKKQSRFTALGITGLVIALLALGGAVLSPWIVDQLQPRGSGKPIDEVAVDTAFKIKDRVAAKIKGEEYVADPSDEPKGIAWNKVVPVSVNGTGMLAICFGVVGFIRRDDPRVSGATTAIALGAIIFQYFVILASLLLLAFLVAVICGLLGISP